MAGAGHYGEGEGTGEKSAFRWIDAARYAVAAVVLVLIVAVIVNAIKLVFRPESLSLSVIGGTVFVRPLQPPPPQPASLLFDLNLRALNPSGRVLMYFHNITGYLFDSNTSAAAPDPEPGSFLEFLLPDMAVLPLRAMDNLAQLNGTRDLMIESYFDELFNSNSSSVRGVTVRLDGVLITEVAVKNKTRTTTYYCGPVLVVRGDPGDAAFRDPPDAPCSDQERQLGS